jgi:hypothetical protein
MAEDGRESKNGRLAEGTQTSGANVPSPPIQILPQQEQEIVVAPLFGAQGSANAYTVFDV